MIHIVLIHCILQCFKCGINAAISHLAVVLFEFNFTNVDDETHKEKTIIHQHTTSSESSTEQNDSSGTESQDFLDFSF